MNQLFTTATQPIFDAQDYRVEYQETLLRVTDDSTDKAHGCFIVAAERHNVIHLFDAFVLNDVLAKLHNSLDHVGVNLSPLSIQRIGHTLLESIDRYTEQASRLVVELTETAGVADVAGLKEFLAELRARGVRVAIDDFGSPSGAFSERLCSHIRPDYIKLDGEFLESLMRSENPLPLIRIKNLARLIGAELIAEKIDNAAKLKFVLTAGIRFAQGNFLQSPRRSSIKLELPAATFNG